MVRLLSIVAVLALSTALRAAAQGVPQLGPRVAQLGDAFGSGPNVFGEIRGVEVDSVGHVFVLDGLSQQVRIFNPDLTPLATLGREGNGPGEFARGASLSADLDGADRLHVVDSRNLRVTVLSAGPVPSILSMVRTAVPGVGICSGPTGDYLWTGVDSSFVVANLDNEGDVSRLLVERERPSAGWSRVLEGSDYFLNQGSIACDRASGAIAVAYQFHPLVQAFSSKGRLLWRQNLADYHQQQFRRSQSGHCCIYLLPNPKSGTYHVAEAVVAPGDGFVYVTLRESGPTSTEGRYEVRILMARDGAEVGRFDAPGILATIRRGRGYFVVPAPVPMIVVHRLEG